MEGAGRGRKTRCLLYISPPDLIRLIISKATCTQAFILSITFAHFCYSSSTLTGIQGRTKHPKLLIINHPWQRIACADSQTKQGYKSRKVKINSKSKTYFFSMFGHLCTSCLSQNVSCWLYVVVMFQQQKWGKNVNCFGVDGTLRTLLVVCLY